MEDLTTYLHVLHEENPKAVVFEGLDEAILGVARQYSKKPLLLYSRQKIIKTLMRKQKWDLETAQEWFDANIGCLWAGPGTPLILED